jgi:hypothetical protein
MVIHGGNMGGLDGIDVWSTNIHIHDIEVSNKDECVTVKVWFRPRYRHRPMEQGADSSNSESCQEHLD